MHPRLIRDLRSGDRPAWGILLMFHCAEMVEFCGLLGFEWLMLDAEHTPLSPRVCRELIRAADLAGLSCLVRVPEIKASLIEGFLDVGVAGILAPDVSSADEARALVSAVKFGPQGKRGSAAASRAANYGLTQSAAEYALSANEFTFTAALIESRKGIEQLDSIMSVPGLDCIALGANDLGLSMGLAGGMSSPQVRALVEATQARIRAARKRQLTIVADTDAADVAVASGATLIAISDATLLACAGRDFLAQVRR